MSPLLLGWRENPISVIFKSPYTTTPPTPTPSPPAAYKNAGAFVIHLGKAIWSGPLSILVTEYWSIFSNPSGSFHGGWLLFAGSTPLLDSLPCLWEPHPLLLSQQAPPPGASAFHILCGSASSLNFLVWPEHQCNTSKLYSLLEEEKPGLAHRTFQPPSTIRMRIGKKN